MMLIDVDQIKSGSEYDGSHTLESVAVLKTLVNTLRPRQLLQSTYSNAFLNENFRIWIGVSLKVFPKGSINSTPALVQIIAWHWIDNNPLSKPMRAQVTDAYIHSASVR